MAKIGAWEYNGDVNMTEYGGKWIRQVGERVFQVIEFTNMANECPEAAEPGRYVVDLSLVDLTVIPASEIDSAKRSYGWEPAPEVEGTITWPKWMAIAEACHDYGLKAPLDSWQGNNARKLIRNARAMANGLARNADSLRRALDKPVNAIGSTAREFMAGDIHSAVSRGVARGDLGAMVIRKMEDAATVTCPTCAGKGAASAGPAVGVCATCLGRGKVVTTLGGMVPAP